MSELRTQPISTSELETEASVEGSTVHLTLTGTADLEAVEPLKGMLPDLHSEAVRIGAKEVRVDLRNLEFMNSSCFKVFITWLHKVRSLAQDKQYHFVFLSSPKQRWQERSLHALKNFARDLISVENDLAER